MNNKFIDANALADVIDSMPTVQGQDNAVFINDVIQAINDAPSEDVQKVRHGWWDMDESTGDLRCSECGHFTCEILSEFKEINGQVFHCSINPLYCVRCGAKMDRNGGDNK